MPEVLLGALSAFSIAAAATVPVDPEPTASSQSTACPVEGRATLDVLTYNIEGLGYPIKRHRKAQLHEIGQRLKGLRKEGKAPDVVLFQEAFSHTAKAAVVQVGYPNVVEGPRRDARRELPVDREDRQGSGKPSIARGEFGVKILSGGLAVATALPVEAQASQPFARGSCAGYDCLANKGAILVRLRLPGAPEPIEIYNTHMNSRGASKAPAIRSLAMHHAQAGELATFIDTEHRAGNPMILGGDFNMRHSEARFDFFASRIQLTLARKHCQDPRSGCDVQISFDGDAPWMDTQDLQFFRSGSLTRIRPIRVAAMFDGKADSPKLSDHDGYRVTYEISWPLDLEKCSTVSEQRVGEPADE